MTKPSPLVVIFASPHRWFMVALAFLCLGLLGVLLLSMIPALDAGAVSLTSGICFFLSTVSTSIWLYALAHRHNALLPLQSSNIRDLAIKKLVIVLGIRFALSVLPDSSTCHAGCDNCGGKLFAVCHTA
jgi:hypothetical protein